MLCRDFGLILNATLLLTGRLSISTRRQENPGDFGGLSIIYGLHRSSSGAWLLQWAIDFGDILINRKFADTVHSRIRKLLFGLANSAPGSVLSEIKAWQVRGVHRNRSVHLETHIIHNQCWHCATQNQRDKISFVGKTAQRCNQILEDRGPDGNATSCNSTRRRDG